MKEELIAPCGINCAVCSAYLAARHDIKSRGVRMPYCAGCRPRYKQSAFLKKHYQLLLKGEVEYCNECLDYPCKNLRHIDKRYCTLYRMSILDNLEIIRQHGVAKLIEREERKWRCPECGDVICCHNGICFNCGIERIKAKEKPYRWEDD